MRYPFQRRCTQLLLFLTLILLLPALALAAVNIGRANLGADPLPADGDFITDSPPLTITATTLAVVKKAFLDDNSGTEIPSGSSLAKGTFVKFLIYIDNSAAIVASDVRIEDLLDKTAFTYQAGSLHWNNSVTASAAGVATIFSDTNTGPALSDATSAADTGSADTVALPASVRITFGAHSLQANSALNIPAGKIAGFLFRARLN